MFVSKCLAVFLLCSISGITCYNETKTTENYPSTTTTPVPTTPTNDGGLSTCHETYNVKLGEAYVFHYGPTQQSSYSRDKRQTYDYMLFDDLFTRSADLSPRKYNNPYDNTQDGNGRNCTWTFLKEGDYCTLTAYLTQYNVGHPHCSKQYLKFSGGEKNYMLCGQKRPFYNGYKATGDSLVIQHYLHGDPEPTEFKGYVICQEDYKTQQQSSTGYKHTSDLYNGEYSKNYDNAEFAFPYHGSSFGNHKFRPYNNRHYNGLYGPAFPRFNQQFAY